MSGVLKRVDVDEGFGGHVYRSEIKALEVKGDLREGIYTKKRTADQ